MSENTYIAITIGPIFDTMSAVSTPAALWASSYMFSCITANICKELTENYGINNEDIISPCYDPQDELLNRNDGVGLFHDRLIVKVPEEFDVSKIKDVRKAVIDKINADFELNAFDYLNEYLMIKAVKYSSSSPILDSGKALDSLELAKPFVRVQKSNPVLDKFTDSNDATVRIAIDNLNIEKKSWQLINRKGSVRTLGDIAAYSDAADKSLKKTQYYAIVRSDGDNMTQIIKSLKNDDEIRSFSHSCLKYCSRISEIVKEYGGMTVYAGGDDLLALLPCESSDSKTVFDFSVEASKAFSKSFENFRLDDYSKKPSLSFGIFICYNKFPLYEALQKSAHLLFDVAKKQKNCIAFMLQKHSGQSSGFVIANSFVPEYLKLQSYVLEKAENEDSDGNDETQDKVLLSASQKVSLFSELFEFAGNDREKTFNTFENVFDAVSHKNNAFVHEILPEFYCKLTKEALVDITNREKTGGFSKVRSFETVIRTIKFYTEKKGEKE